MRIKKWHRAMWKFLCEPSAESASRALELVPRNAGARPRVELAAKLFAKGDLEHAREAISVRGNGWEWSNPDVRHLEALA